MFDPVGKLSDRYIQSQPWISNLCKSGLDLERTLAFINSPPLQRSLWKNSLKIHTGRNLSPMVGWFSQKVRLKAIILSHI